MSALTKAEFKLRWESDANAGGITFDDIAECAKAWGITAHPKINSTHRIRYWVLKAANTVDAEEFRPTDER